MTVPDGQSRRPGVYARLAQEAEAQRTVRSPSPRVRWTGRVICVAIAVGVIAAALQVHPW